MTKELLFLSNKSKLLNKEKTLPPSGSAESSRPSPEMPPQQEDIKTETRKGESSFAKMFSYLLTVFLVLQTLAGTAVIVVFIRGEMLDMQYANLSNELTGHKNSLESYLDDRLHILKDYAQLPILVAGVMQPEEHLPNTVDLLESLPFLKNNAMFSLQSFEGKNIYSKWKEQNNAASPMFQKLMDGSSESAIEVVTAADTPSTYYWKLSVPVLYHGLAEGVLSAYFPVQLEDKIYTAESDVRVTLLASGNPIESIGLAAPPVITLETALEFDGLVLQQSVSKKRINERIEFIIFAMSLALVLGTIVIWFIVQRIGKRLLLVPHERLQSMHEELERKVEQRTKDLEKQKADLNLRTEQLTHEIRERREAEIEAKETGKLVSALLEGIGAAFFIVDPTTNIITRSNAKVQDIFGLAPWEVDNQSCSKLLVDFSEDMAQQLCPSEIGSETYMEGTAQHADGTSFSIARYLVPMEVQGRYHIGVIVLDITKRKGLERRLNVAQKLESLGELASGIAHEINTPVQYVGDSIRFVQDSVSDMVEIMQAQAEIITKDKEAGLHEDLIEHIEELEDDADLEFIIEEIPKACARSLEGTARVAAIVRAMKNFAHPGTGEKSLVDINHAIENTITVSKNEWKYVADVETNFGEIPTVLCYPGDINQVLLNVIVNAAHAIKEKIAGADEKGTITISTDATDSELNIKISDTGSGIPDEIREKIFDPFFTTKEVGKGTGQGLAISHDIIVERHGGSIDIESDLGEGTTFIIKLPLSQQ